MCTYALLAHMPRHRDPGVLSGEAQKGSKGEGDMEYSVNNMVSGVIMTVACYTMTSCTYVGSAGVIWSIFTIEHPAGPQYTSPISVQRSA